MKVINEYGSGFWPSRQQELLLKAGLQSGKEAYESWKEWTSQVSPNNIDPGSYRVLPLAVGNLESMGMKDPVLSRFKGLRRKTWYKNQLLFHSLKRVLASFREEGIQAMLLKGTALNFLYYKDFSLRPQNDVDILIPPESVSTAFRILTASGWKIDGTLRKGIRRENLNVHNACHFGNGMAAWIDLHWHAVRECVYPGADRDYWKYAHPLKIDGEEAYVMSPEDLIYCSCIHAVTHSAGWSTLSSVNWVADVMFILKRSDGEIDFQRMVEHAQNHNMVLPLRRGMRYLRQTFKVLLPDEFMRRLEEAPVSLLEYKEDRIRENSSRFLGPFVIRWYYYLRCTQGDGSSSLFSKIYGFMKYLKVQYRLNSILWMPFKLFFKGISIYIKQ